jgi:hypothetical protein
MRFLQIFAGLALFSSVLAATVEVEQPEVSEAETEEGGVIVQASFPEENAFGHVVNGERNRMSIMVENKSKLNVTLLMVGGAMHHPDTGALVKNLTHAPLQFPLSNGVKFQIPYTFHSEFKPGDLRLNLWLDHTLGEEVIRATAYDAVVTIVEPEISLLDFKMVTTYLMVLALLGGGGYFAYLSFVPQTTTKKARKPVKAEISAPEGSVTASGAGGYQEEWIPEHHLKKKTPKRTKSAGGLTSGTSGDELSTAEVSGTEGKKKKGRQ